MWNDNINMPIRYEAMSNTTLWSDWNTQVCVKKRWAKRSKCSLEFSYLSDNWKWCHCYLRSTNTVINLGNICSTVPRLGFEMTPYRMQFSKNNSYCIWPVVPKNLANTCVSPRLHNLLHQDVRYSTEIRNVAASRYSHMDTLGKLQMPINSISV
jgi:hypothetical protein